MKISLSFPATLVALSALLVLMSALGIRASKPSVDISPYSFESVVGDWQERAQISDGSVTTTVPEFASASFPDGDALKGLGADWTFVRQDNVSGKLASALPGTEATRESVIKIVGKDTQLLLTEFEITDAKKLQASLKDASTKKVTVAERSGYIIPTNDIAGGTGFLLVGDSTTLLFQDSRAAEWPKELESEILSYIATVRVP